MNRKESGSGAGPYRPCLRRESQAITHREIPCQASHSLSQAKAKSQLPLPGTAQGALGDVGRRGGSTSCFPAPRQQRSRTGTREKQAPPACSSTGTDRAHREMENTGMSRSVGLCGDWQLSWLPGHICTTRCRTSWEQTGAWAGALEAEELLPQPCA